MKEVFSDRYKASIQQRGAKYGRSTYYDEYAYGTICMDAFTVRDK